ncbi:EAL domain-containing protein [Neobacillus terrae]|uniref:EAL domain-containing protein n=1 Tax=Neobacillus terrae TaxID=3034837 RepID=UPI00140BAF43|nr:EAL domain-containing protein [Neobacillus terrae]NHM31573.1 EAL domain-containing protein [Neobacillus terrae]
MDIKKKLPLIFTLLVFAILLSNNTIHFFQSKEELLKQNNREITLLAQELSFQVQQAKEGSLFVEDQLGRELRIASVAIKKSLPPNYEQVTNDQLTALSKELMISHITLLGKTNNDIIGVRSSDPDELNMSTKDWGYWHTAFNQLFVNKNVTIKKGQSLPNYWSGPVEVASSNPKHIDKWGYYYEGSTNYIIDPYLRDKEVLAYEDRFGPIKIINRFTDNLEGVLELTVFNPKKFGEKKEIINDNGKPYTRISAEPIWYGTYHFNNRDTDQKYIKKAIKTGKQQSYIKVLNGKKVQKTFVPSKLGPDEPFVLGFTYDYGVIDKQLHKELVKHIILSGIFMLLVLITSVIFSRAITRPIDYIAEQVNEIAKGNFGKTIESIRKDELGFLARNVNAMSSSLKTYVDNFKTSQQMIEYQALHDPLTGLPNRRHATEKLTALLSFIKENGENVALMFIDIDRFKNVNDSLGHNMGDELIRQIANRLKTCALLSKGFISRQGGDEFIIILENAQMEALQELGNKVVDSLKKPYFIDGTEVFVGASCGVSVFPDHSEDIDTLIMYADMAMYEAKNQGGNCVVFYNERLNEKNQKRLTMETRLRKAIQEEKIDVYFQPKINAKTGYITGVEALVRWTDEELGSVSPEIFIPVAEDSGLALPIWEFVMGQACKMASEWKEKYPFPLTMAVNFSAKQFQNPSALIKRVKEFLTFYKLPGELFEIEITESVLLYNTNETIAALSELRDEGIRVAIDDFGTGYSSLSYLKRLPINTLKIDRSFITDIDEAYNNAEIAYAIINLAKSLRLQVIAEGVEKAYQVQYLLENECTEMQGYYYSKPAKASDFEDLLSMQGTFTA